MNYEIKAARPVALDSKDHLYPKGVKMAFTCGAFLDDLAAYFGRPFSLLDLGCAGGGLVVDALGRGLETVGVDGSDYNLTTQREPELKHPEERGEGFDNWRDYGGANLFTADVSQRFQITRDGKRARFDAVTAWELLEHIREGDLPQIIDNVLYHMGRGGLFVASVATIPDTFNTPGGVNMHETVKPAEWWAKLLDWWFAPVEPCPVTHWMMRETRASSLWFCGRAREQG